MSYKLGIIGSGNMAKVIAKGLINAKIFESVEIIASDVSESQLNKVKEELNIDITMSNAEVVENSDIIMFAVKPQYFESAIGNIDREKFKGKTAVSIMAGISIERLKDKVGDSCSVARVMPNTPALVNEAMSVICFDEKMDEENKSAIIQMFESIGKVKVLNEVQIDAVTAISGSSPAYVYMMIEAMADAGVLLGLGREDAYMLASQSILGSAKMYLETKMHPGQLKDMVCSPAGTTIEAVKVLEQKGFRSALIEAMIACEQKSKAMGKK